MSKRFPTIAKDLLSPWMDDRCERGRYVFDRAGALWDSWREYAHSRGAEPGSPAEFAAHMQARGFEIDQLQGDRHRIRWGLRLRSAQHEGGGQKFGDRGIGRTASPLTRRVFSRFVEFWPEAKPWQHA